MLLAVPPKGQRVSLYENSYILFIEQITSHIYFLPDSLCSYGLFCTSFLLSSTTRRPLFAYVKTASLLHTHSLKTSRTPSPAPNPEQNSHKSVDQGDGKYSHSLEAKYFLLFTALPPKILVKK